MPTPRPPAAMSADEFQSILDATDLTDREAAAVLGLSSTAVRRLLRGAEPITAETAALIRERFKPKPPTG